MNVRLPLRGVCSVNWLGEDLMVMPRLLNDKLSLWAARSVDPLGEDDQIISMNRGLLGQVCQ